MKFLCNYFVEIYMKFLCNNYSQAPRWLRLIRLSCGHWAGSLRLNCSHGQGGRCSSAGPSQRLPGPQ